MLNVNQSTEPRRYVHYSYSTRVTRACCGSYGTWLTLLGLSAAVTACASEAPSLASDASAHLVVDGRVLDCRRPQVVGIVDEVSTLELVGVDASALATEGALLEDTNTKTVKRIKLQQVPLAHLRATLPSGEVCRVYFRDSGPEQQALEALTLAPGAKSRRVVSLDTGSLTHLVTHAPLADVDARSGLQEVPLIGAIAPLIGLQPDMLRVVGVEEPESNDWLRVDLQQVIDDIPVMDGTVHAYLGAGDALRLLHTGVMPYLGGLPHAAHLLDAAQASALFDADGPQGGEEGAVEPVWYNPMMLDPAEEPGLKPGWLFTSSERVALLDDSSNEMLRESALVAEVQAQLYLGKATDDALPMLVGFSGPAFSELELALEGPVGADEPSLVAAGKSNEVGTVELDYWRWLSAISSYAGKHYGQSNWKPFSPVGTTQVHPLGQGEVRLYLGDDLVGSDAFFSGTIGFIAIRLGTFDLDPDVLCHEYGHALHWANTPAIVFARRPFNELVAEVFMFGCEHRLFPGRIPWRLADSGARSVDHRDPGHYDTTPDASKLFTEDMANPYIPMRVVTHALYHAVETYGLDYARMEALLGEMLPLRPASYRDVRDHWIATALAWSEERDHGFTSDDVCALAKGFRVTGLDGDYGPEHSSTPDDLVCSEASCPMCNELCPARIEAKVGEEVEVEANPQDRSEPRYAWQLLEAPEGSEVEGFEPDDEQQIRFTPDKEGTFFVEVKVTDADGEVATCETEVEATPCGAEECPHPCDQFDKCSTCAGSNLICRWIEPRDGSAPGRCEKLDFSNFNSTSSEERVFRTAYECTDCTQGVNDPKTCLGMGLCGVCRNAADTNGCIALLPGDSDNIEALCPGGYFPTKAAYCQRQPLDIGACIP